MQTSNHFFPPIFIFLLQTFNILLVYFLSSTHRPGLPFYIHPTTSHGSSDPDTFGQTIALSNTSLLRYCAQHLLRNLNSYALTKTREPPVLLQNFIFKLTSYTDPFSLLRLRRLGSLLVHQQRHHTSPSALTSCKKLPNLLHLLILVSPLNLLPPTFRTFTPHLIILHGPPRLLTSCTKSSNLLQLPRLVSPPTLPLAPPHRTPKLHLIFLRAPLPTSCSFYGRLTSWALAFPTHLEHHHSTCHQLAATLLLLQHLHICQSHRLSTLSCLCLTSTLHLPILLAKFHAKPIY